MTVPTQTLRASLFSVLLMLVIALAACGSPAQPQPAAADIPAPASEPADAPVQEDAAPEAAQAEAAVETGATVRTFIIAPERSEVRFIIDEILNGAPKTVIGVNNLVEGEILVDPAAPANTQLGAISIDAGGFVTDDNRRNNAIRRFVLQTERFPVVLFTPTEISGLPTSTNAGDSFDFQVTGDLAILNSTNPVTFDLTADVLSENEIQISGSTTIDRGSFGLSIPSVPFVASVDEELILELDLVAVAGE